MGLNRIKILTTMIFFFFFWRGRSQSRWNVVKSKTKPWESSENLGDTSAELYWYYMHSSDGGTMCIIHYYAFVTLAHVQWYYIEYVTSYNLQCRNPKIKRRVKYYSTHPTSIVGPGAVLDQFLPLAVEGYAQYYL